jgi:hypothetical protein
MSCQEIKVKKSAFKHEEIIEHQEWLREKNVRVYFIF